MDISYSATDIEFACAGENASSITIFIHPSISLISVYLDWISKRKWAHIFINCEREKRVCVIHLWYALMCVSHIPVLFHTCEIQNTRAPIDYKRAFCPGRVSKFREKRTGLVEFQITKARPWWCVYGSLQTQTLCRWGLAFWETNTQHLYFFSRAVRH